jgi:carboxypeptidase C (cathepsin A)
MPIELQSNAEGSFFFWLAMQRSIDDLDDVDPAAQTLVIWLNGGPGMKPDGEYCR